MEEERSVPIPHTTGRRKSSISWKTTWNLKRQLSRVDMKIKNSGKSSKDKRNSIFYSDASPNQDIDNLEEENSSKSSPESEENTVIDNQAVSPRECKTGIDECEGREEFVSPEVQLSDEDIDNNTALIVGSLGTQYEIGSNRKVSFTNRPDNLDLLDENGCPIRPPRRMKKKLTETRDQRLLSVPIIKYQKNSMCDLRDKEDKFEANQQPTFAGQLIRRFSKF